MVKKVIGLLNKEFNNINQAAILLGGFMLLSQILGLFRDRAFAHFLGPSAPLDIYYASFKLPDLLFVSVASLASVTVLLPFLMKRLGNTENGELQQTSKKARSFLNDTFSAFLIVMIVVSVILYILMPHLAPVVAPGFSGEQLIELIKVSRIMILSPIFLGISNLLGSVTQMFRKFFVFALSPVFYNIGIIAGVVFLYPAFGLNGLAYGVIIGAILHAGIQLPVIARHRFLPKFSFKINWPDIREMVRLSFPRTLGLAIHSLILLVLIAIASKIGEGSISIFQFSWNLQNVPLGIIGVSYSVAAFPTLAQFFTTDRMGEFVSYITTAARQIIFWSLPVAFLFIVLRAQIVRVILGTGSFSWDDTRLVAASLALFSLSVVAQSLILLFTRGYYAAGNTRKPVIINLVSSGLTLVLAFALTKWFVTNNFLQSFTESLLRIKDIPGSQIVMLSFAFSVGMIVNAFALWISFRKDFIKSKKPFLRRTLFESFLGSFFIGYSAYLMLGVLDDVFNLDTFWGILGQGFFAGIIGIGVGIAVLKLLKNKQINEMQKAFHTKFWKTEVVTTGQDEF